jgi:malate dehydrogenase (oxaloacetate-decarboxylating)(NADP+)
MDLRTDALNYHRTGRPGKIEVVSTKPCRTQRDLSLAYTPGVAEPCREIEKNPEAVYEYTSKGNLVAVVSNGTAVLGLGHIGAAAGKPVMEGKGVLFKRFADVDVFDIEINSLDADEIIRTVQILEPTFGGINLEDIAAPDCFKIEEALIKTMNIPVFHDDQHGTAIISGAAIWNGLELQKKELGKVRLVVCGAGAAGIASAKILVALGMKPEQIVMVDRSGVIYKGREKGMNPYKALFATDEKCRTLAEAMKGADIFLGLSDANLVTPEMVASMAPRPIILAMANPDPEIRYETARKVRSDLIMGTGRSDYPNQVNNVLGFPFIFRGALDVRASAINMQMKLAALHALAELARQSVPESVLRAYGHGHFAFGPDYIIPKPFDPRVMPWEATAVARAAMASGVARKPVDIDAYHEQLESRLGPAREAMRHITHRARKDPRPVVFPEGANAKVLRAAAEIVEDKIARPILLGPADEIRKAAVDLGVSLEGVSLVDPLKSENYDAYVKDLFTLRQRKGVTMEDARRMARDPNVFAALMLRRGEADGLVAGLTQHYPETIRPMLQVIGARPGVKHVVGVFLMTFRNRSFFIADTTINVDPDASTLAEIAILTSEVARRFSIEPRVAMLSYSNFGSVNHSLPKLVAEATRLVRQRAPDLVVDGEMQADTAVAPEFATEYFPFSLIKGDANVLIFPGLASSNIGYKLLQRLGGAEVIGPILYGMAKPVHIMHQSSEVADIVNVTAIAVADAQDLSRAPEAGPTLPVVKAKAELVGAGR